MAVMARTRSHPALVKFAEAEKHAPPGSIPLLRKNPNPSRRKHDQNRQT
jgi:hypothetical protein